MGFAVFMAAERRTPSGFRQQNIAQRRQHSIATQLYEAGASLLWMQQFLGHANLQTTLIYLHLTDDVEPVGIGEAALKYLAPYVHRVAISNNRILKVDQQGVSYSFTPSGSTRSKQGLTRFHS